MSVLVLHIQFTFNEHKQQKMRKEVLISVKFMCKIKMSNRKKKLFTKMNKKNIQYDDLQAEH